MYGGQKKIVRVSPEFYVGLLLRNFHMEDCCHVLLVMRRGELGYRDVSHGWLRVWGLGLLWAWVSPCPIGHK